MTLRTPTAERLDVAAFAEAGGELAGVWPLPRLPRLAAAVMHADIDVPVQWTLRGERRTRVGAAAQVWLHASAHATVQIQCQRCLEPIEQILDVSASFQFVADENEAEKLDLDSEHDVLALTPVLNAMELLEDELLLALPGVPRHADCAIPAAGRTDADTEAAPAHPFAALAALKTPRRDN
jgi:uncharacterized protein